MSNQSERIRTALRRNLETGQPAVPAADETHGDTATSSISVSAENFEALLQGINGKPVDQRPRPVEHASSISVSAEALQALMPGEEVAMPASASELAAEDAVAVAEQDRLETGPPEADVYAEGIPAPPVEPQAKPQVETTLPLLAARDRERVEKARLAAPGARVVGPARAAPPLVRPSMIPATARPIPSPSARPAASIPSLIVPSAPPGDSRKTMLMAGGAAVVVVLGLGAYFIWGRAGRPAAASTSQPILALQLAAESMGSGLVNVRWNPQSALVAKAQSGRLVIKEGDQQPRTVTLAQAELKTGHLLYQSPADKLEFRLETVEASGASTGETIAMVTPKNSASSAPGSPQPQPGTSQSFQPPAPAQPTVTAQTGFARPQAVAASPAGPTPPEAQPAPIPAPRTQPRAFTLPAQGAGPVEAARGGVILDAPGAVPGAVPGNAGLSLPSAGLPGAFPAPPPAAAPAPQAAQPRSGGDLQPAVLIRKVAPAYPPLAKAARIQGAVRFSATVGKDGHLLNVQVLGGHSALVQAATDAVKQWVYRPTMLNGEPVEVVTQLEVNFTLNDTGR